MRSPHRPAAASHDRIGRSAAATAGFFVLLGALGSLAGCERFETGSPESRMAALRALESPRDPPNALRNALDHWSEGQPDRALKEFLAAAALPEDEERTMTTVTRLRFAELSEEARQDVLLVFDYRGVAWSELIAELRRGIAFAESQGDHATAARWLAAIRDVAALNAREEWPPPISATAQRTLQSLSASVAAGDEGDARDDAPSTTAPEGPGAPMP